MVRGLTGRTLWVILQESSGIHPMARKIEQQMNEAIRDRKDWHKANTRVSYDPETQISRVYLHNNLISEIGDGFLKLYDGGWQSVTTKSRLSAILKANGADDGIYQKDFQWYIWNGKERKSEEFYNGMILS